MEQQNQQQQQKQQMHTNIESIVEVKPVQISSTFANVRLETIQEFVPLPAYNRMIDVVSATSTVDTSYNTALANGENNSSNINEYETVDNDDDEHTGAGVGCCGANGNAQTGASASVSVSSTSSSSSAAADRYNEYASNEDDSSARSDSSLDMNVAMPKVL